MTVDIQLSDLITPVAASLGVADFHIVDWAVQRISGGSAEQYAGGLGVYRVAGTARRTNGTQRWSIILKAASGSVGTGSDNPTDWSYWRREVMAYRTGLLDNLPGGLAAPRCYAVLDRPDDTVWLWLEDVASSAAAWELSRHGEAACHFGLFNGAYLAGYPLPKAELWMSWGRTRPWVEWSASCVAHSRQYADTPVGRQMFGKSGLDRTLRLWQSVPQLLDAFERLPVCFCHHDAYRRNLLDRSLRGGDNATVAIDWALVGFGRVGEEVGAMTGLNLAYLETPASQARELDRVIFGAYVDGLRDAGWRGSEHLARLGYVVNAFVLIGITWNLGHLQEFQKSEHVMAVEEMIGRPADEVVAQWAEALPFILDLGEEACQLADDF